jgi:hypothetical protein
VRRIVETAKDCQISYLRSKREQKPGTELIRAAADLAQLDLVYRIGQLDLRSIKPQSQTKRHFRPAATLITCRP